MYRSLNHLKKAKKKLRSTRYLVFREDLEAAFVLHETADNALFYKIALLIIYLLIPLSGGIDILIDINMAKYIWELRATLFLPVFSCIVVLSLFRQSKPYLEKIMLTGLIILSSLMMLIIVNIPVEHMYTYYSGYLVVVVVGLSACRLSFNDCILFSIAAFLFLFAGQIYSDSKIKPAVIQLYLFSGACGLGLLVSYSSEKKVRMNFLQQLIVDEQNFHLERVNKELELVASTDALTGIANRRCFDVIISREWKIAIRNNTQVSLLMIDVDKFKVYNDTYGHQQGDQCLAMVADVLQSAGKRPSDCIARYGGEEFVVLLPGIGLDSAKKIAEQIRLTVEKTRLLNGSVDKGGVTVSIGVATLCPRAGEPLENLIKEADRNLYKAKGIGRNQVIC